MTVSLVCVLSRIWKNEEAKSVKKGDFWHLILHIETMLARKEKESTFACSINIVWFPPG